MPYDPSAQLHIDGQWRDAGGRDTLPVVNPTTGQTVATLPVATPVDLDDALAASHRAFASWRATPAVERAAVLHKTAALIRASAEDLGRTITTELGNTLSATTFEAMVASDVFDWSAGEARRLYGRLIPSRFPGVRQLAIREPIGPVFAACPWNMPLIFPARKIAEALAAGCTVVIKPAEETPGPACALVRLLEQAGLPPGVVNLVFGVPDMISRHLLGSGVIRKLSFTGSVPVGKHLARLAADHLVKCTLELGGHAPTIVFDDAPIDSVAAMLAERKARVSGQVCNSPTRIYVQEGIYARFRDAFSARLASVRVGDPMQSDTQMGPVVNRRRLDAVAGLIADARTHGATVVTGNKALTGSGFFHPLTLIEDVPDSARIMQEEPFGPVAAMQPFDTLETVIGKANALPYGLAAYAFTSSKATLDILADRLEVGLLGLNHCNIAAAETPFGGMKDSGYGSEGGQEGVEGYLVTKLVSEMASPA